MKFLSCIIIMVLAIAPSLATFNTIGEIKGKFGLGASSAGYNSYGGNYGYGRGYGYGPAYSSGYVNRPNVGYSGYSSAYAGQQTSVATGGYGYQGPPNEQVIKIIRVVVPNNYGTGYAPGYAGSTYNFGQSVSSSVIPAQQAQIAQVQLPQYQVQVSQPQRPVLVQLPQQQQSVNYVPAVAAPVATAQVAPPVVTAVPVATPTVLQTYVPGIRSSQNIVSSSSFSAPKLVGPSVQYTPTSYSSPPVSTVRLIYSNAGDNQRQYSSSSTSDLNVAYGPPSTGEYSSNEYGNNGVTVNSGC